MIKGVVIKSGASCFCHIRVTIGEWALIGAGSVVIKDVPNYAIVVGNPSRQIGWVGKSGIQLIQKGSLLVCPITGESYIKTDEGIELVSS